MLLNQIKSKFQSILRLGVPKQNFAIFTNQINIYKNVEKIEDYSRQTIRLKVESPTPEEQLRINEEKKIAEKNAYFFNLRSNDKNPNNYVKAKVNNLQLLMTQNQTNQELAPNLMKPYILKVSPRPEQITVSGRRRKVYCSPKKVIPIMKGIIGKHLYDAIVYLQNSRTKASKYILQTLQQVRRHGLQKQMDEERFYVSSAITGKHRRLKRLRYHAKGRAHLMVRQSSQLFITLQEKPVEYMYKEMITGKTPPMLAYLIRKRLVEADVDLETLRRNTFLLTSKGRQQRRAMFKRQVLQRMLELKKQGVNVSKKIIAKKILEDEAITYANKYRESKIEQLKSGLNERQAVFKRNEELTK